MFAQILGIGIVGIRVRYNSFIFMALFLAYFANIWGTFHFRFPGVFIFAIERYLWSRPERLLVFLTVVRPDVLWRIADRKLIVLFNQYLRATPALQGVQKKFFPGRGIRSVRTFKAYVPILDKKNYYHAYSLEELCRGGRIPKAGTFYQSAGTSGNPTLWFESVEEELEFDREVAFLGHAMLDTSKKEYLIVNCWAFGLWPSGINFFASARFQGKMLNVGPDIETTVKMLTMLGPKHRYLVAGYPPFLYRLLLAAEASGLRLADYEIHVVSGGEGFVEEWRDEFIRRFGKKSVIFSTYGTTDKGLAEAMESNFSYAIRSLMYVASEFLRDEEAARGIMRLRFGRDSVPFTKETAREFLLSFVGEEKNIGRVPMVFQFNPLAFYNENHTFFDPHQKREVHEFATTVLSRVAIPRVRYNVHDEGRVVSYDDVKRILQKFSIRIFDYNPRSDAYMDLHLPFLFLYGRSDGTVSIDGANIFPEDVEECLRLDAALFLSLNSFQLFVTRDYRFGVSLELVSDSGGGIGEKDVKSFLERELGRFSMGYRELVEDKLPSADIKVEVFPFGTGPFADRNVKLRYIRK